MKNSIVLICICFATALQAQDSIVHRVILIGDAGEINHEQETLIPDAARHVIEGKTTVVYLGDNIYPNGMALSDSADIARTEKIMRSQYEPMRAKNARVYFIPGNHDWDRMGSLGLAKMKAQWKFIESQNDSLLKVVPRDGCPDPVAIAVSDSMTIIAYDSEWWLFTPEKNNPLANCSCDTEEEVVEQMNALFYKSRNKVILLAGHHPFASYGAHGGFYNWKDHIFPLAAWHKKLFIPLPVIGSLYPVLRSTVFLNPEDLHHPLYKHMMARVDHVFEDFPNVTYVAGHEHGLQLIKNKDRLQVVSGAGAKHTFTKKGKYTLYANATQGFVTADLLIDKSLKFTYYAYTEKGIEAQYTYTRLYVKPEIPLVTNISTADSVAVEANPAYDEVNNFHRKLFGAGYRKEWAAKETLPLIRISQFAGGLKPVQRGGGMQSVSLRLEDSTGRQWVIRSVNKNPDGLLPEILRQTFTRDWLDDATSSQHPYSALMVPPIANAVHVPYANPVIGIIAPDTALGIYGKLVQNTLCLIEEREPLGKSDNTAKMEKSLQKDNDNTYDAKAFLRARALDMLLNDWDRHADQWRWKNVSDGKDKNYVGVPRDRDQALRSTKGVLPQMASREWILPTLQGFEDEIKHPEYAIFKSKFMNAYPASQLSEEEWMAEVNAFVALVTDSVLEVSLARLPANSYKTGHDEILKTLKNRRADIPDAMREYYHFSHKIVDIHASNKNELILIDDAPGNALRIRVRKINKEGEVKGKLMDEVYRPELTKEIRIYTGDGNDSVIINNKNADIKLKLIGSEGTKAYQITASKKRIKLYGRPDHVHLYGETNMLRKKLSNDSTATAFVPVNLYNVTMPLLTGGFNLDDGLLIGGGLKYTRQEGFRKQPFASSHQLQGMFSFQTAAFRLRYKSEWLNVIGKTDVTIDGRFFVPNTQNFFGIGNGTEFDQTGNFKKFHRTRFSVFDLNPALRRRSSRFPNSYISIGPSVQYYHSDSDDNEGRLISNSSLIGSYDSATIFKDKYFAGFVADFIKDTRNNKMFPTAGGYMRLRTLGYAGLNEYSRNYIQFLPEMAIYKGIGKYERIVIANRLGGGVTVGDAAFYQSLFLGGQGNLWGYRQYRFAGQQMLYNNFEARIRVAQLGSYILPGQFGVIGFYDAGKVWATENTSNTIHQGYGGGIYFMPAQLALFQLIVSHSDEGWLPYVTMGFRF